MSLTNICIWLSICLVLVAAALFVAAYRWRKALVELEEERRKNRHFMEQVGGLERKLEDAWRTYDNLSHSWPYSDQMKEEQK